MTPAGKISGTTPYAASDEKTVMYGQIDVAYIGNEKSNVPLKIDISVDYDNGYIFDGSAVHIGNCVSVDGDWKYNGEMTFEPLSSNTSRVLRYCVVVPAQVESAADKSLLVTILVNGEAFVAMSAFS